MCNNCNNQINEIKEIVANFNLFLGKQAPSEFGPMLRYYKV